MDPYAGTDAAWLQPAASIDSPYDWDISLVGFSGYLANDYAYLSQTSGIAPLRSFANTTTDIDVEEARFVWRIGEDRYPYEYYGPGGPHYGRVGIEATGPTFSFRLGQNTRVGFQSRVRLLGSGSNLDPEFNFQAYNELPRGAQIAVDETSSAAVWWGEYGLHLAQAIPVLDGEWRIGVSARRLVAFDAVSVYNPEGTTFTKVSLDTIGLENVQTEIGFTNGVRLEADEGVTAGEGYGFDVGVQYAWSELSEGGYQYQLGVSLLDIGTVNLNETAELHRFTNPDPITLSSLDYEFLTEDIAVDSALRQLNLDIFGVEGVSLVNRAFSVGLPTAFSVQMAVRPNKDWQFSAAYVGDLLSGKRRITRGQQLTVAAHFSRWWFGAGLTGGLYEWRHPQLGLQLRLGPIFLSTNRLIGTLLPTQRLRAADFSIGFRLHDFSPRSRERKGRRQGKAVKCYTF